MTRRWLLLIVAASAVAGPIGWAQLRDISAMTTSHSAVVAPRESLLLDGFEAIDGVLFFRSTAERLVAGKLTYRDRLHALAQWTIENVRPQYAGPDRVVADNFNDIIRRGFGYCDQAAHVFATLAHFAGYEVRLLFLRRSDGVSPHTVAEVKIEDRWVLVDPWLGEVLEKDARLLSVDDLERINELPPSYATVLAVDVDDFVRGTRFRTFPYQDLAGFMSKMQSKFLQVPVVDVPDASGRRPAAQADGPLDVVPPESFGSELLAMDQARRAHLEGRYLDAVALYEELLSSHIPNDMRESVRFFRGLALHRAGESDRAVAAFDVALIEAPATEWRPSILAYRGRAKLRLGDMQGAMDDLGKASTPRSLVLLASLRAP